MTAAFKLQPACPDKRDLNLFAAVREVVMAAGHGRADYLPYGDQRAVGVIKVKPEGTTLSGMPLCPGQGEP